MGNKDNAPVGPRGFNVGGSKACSECGSSAEACKNIRRTSNGHSACCAACNPHSHE